MQGVASTVPSDTVVRLHLKLLALQQNAFRADTRTIPPVDVLTWYVYVCEYISERERKGLCVCVCVCVREGARARENKHVALHARTFAPIRNYHVGCILIFRHFFPLKLFLRP